MVSPKIWGDFSFKNYSWEANLLFGEGGGGIYVRVILHEETNDHIISRGIHKCIFQQSEQSKSEASPQSWCDIHLKIKPGPFYGIMEGFILKVNS